jgi:hypothetical protein
VELDLQQQQQQQQHSQAAQQHIIEPLHTCHIACSSTRSYMLHGCETDGGDVLDTAMSLPTRVETC